MKRTLKHELRRGIENLRDDPNVARRREMAEMVKTGLDPDLIAERYNCTRETVRKHCQAFGVPWPEKPNPGRRRTLAILARLLRPQKLDSFSSIGREFGVTRQRVANIYREAVQAGFKLSHWRDREKSALTLYRALDKPGDQS